MLHLRCSQLSQELHLTDPPVLGATVISFEHCEHVYVVVRFGLGDCVARDVDGCLSTVSGDATVGDGVLVCYARHWGWCGLCDRTV